MSPVYTVHPKAIANDHYKSMNNRRYAMFLIKLFVKL